MYCCNPISRSLCKSVQKICIIQQMFNHKSLSIKSVVVQETETSWRFKSKLWTCHAVFPIWLAWLMRQAGDLNTLWLKLFSCESQRTVALSRLYISSRAWLQMTFTIFFVLPEALRSFSFEFYVLDVRTLSNFFFFLPTYLCTAFQFSWILQWIL